MLDPYAVLGISSDADDVAVKKAYRLKSKQYHPDNNPNDPSAEENFKKVQAAYEQITRERKQGYKRDESGSSYSDGSYYGYNDFFGFGGFSSSGTRGYGSTSSGYDSTESDLNSAAAFIRNRCFDQALNVLNSMDERNDKWYYYSAIANMGLGNNVTALNHAKTAAGMNPGNYEYSRLVDSIERGNIQYSNNADVFGMRSAGSSNMCFKLILCNLALNLCFGGSGMCCGSGIGGMPLP